MITDIISDVCQERVEEAKIKTKKHENGKDNTRVEKVVHLDKKRSDSLTIKVS